LVGLQKDSREGAEREHAEHGAMIR
jgi:hypothetical protein